MTTIEKITVQAESSLRSQLVALLQDAVHDGASIGFLAPLSVETAERYWAEVFQEVARDSRILLVARNGDEIVGSVQLGLCLRENGRHRAEVQKLFVHTRSRGKGIARQLMSAIETEAKQARRSLLYLDNSARHAG